MAGASITSPNTTLQTNGNGMVSYTGPKAGIKKVLSNLIPNVPVRVKINLVYSSKPMYIAVAEGSAQSPSVYSNLLYSTMSNGSINFTFTPTQPSVELSMNLFYISTPIAPLPYMSFTLDSVNYKQQTGNGTSTQLVQISNKLKGGYRFGYGNHEKIDEIAGAGNTIDFGARIYDSRIGRFKSIDPLAHKYPSLSPYCFVANNPIYYVDPDGREIWIAFDVTNKDGSTSIQKVQYKGGKLYGTDGKAYTGGNAYATKVQTDLNQLSKDDATLKGRIGTLDKSKNIHTIGKTASADDGNVNTPVSQSNDENGIPTGSNTKYNPDKETNVRGDKRAARAGLAHELLGHGYDSDQGKADYSKTDNGIPMYEVNAVNMENRARAAAGDPKKTTYGGKPIPAKLLDDTHKKKTP
jgi:RHS repeat-associated protein